MKQSDGCKSRGFKLVKRLQTPKYLKAAIPILSICCAFLFCGVLILLFGNNPLTVYLKMFNGAFGTWGRFSTTLTKSIPLMLCGFAISLAFKAQLVNVGAEGQMLLGAWAAAGVALFCDFIPAFLILPAMMLAAMLAGAIWASFAAIPKAYLNVNEILLTLMFNYVAIHFLDYFIYGPWRDPHGNNMPYTAKFLPEQRLPDIGIGVHSGILIAIVTAAVLFLIFHRSVWGYRIRVLGESQKAAHYAGINIPGNIIMTFCLSGAIAGMAGFVEASGTVGLLQAGISNNAGYTGIIIAYLSKFDPLIVLLVSILLGGMQAGGYSMQIAGLPVQIVTMIQGSILLFVLGGEFFTRHRIIWARKDGRAR